MKGLNFQSMFCRIIYIVLWISHCDLFQLEYLRRNEDKNGCMSELVSRKLLSDYQFTASSYYQKQENFKPSMARLHDIHSQASPSDGKAWCPATKVHRDLREWIEVDFHRMSFLKVLYTMGRGDGNFHGFSPEIVIKYTRSDSKAWYTYKDLSNNTIIPINTDSRTKLRTSLATIVARRVRIYPLDTRNGPTSVCLKIAFLGCHFQDEVVSYTSPRGDAGTINGRAVNFKDKLYDGRKSKKLENGLGLLTDNVFLKGSGSIDNYLDLGSWQPFTGWECTAERMRTLISLSFYFDEERVITDVAVFYVTNAFYRMSLPLPIVVSIGHGNDTSHAVFNKTANRRTTDYVIEIPIGQIRGTRCTLSLPCELYQWIVLTEVQIKSTKYYAISNRSDNLPYSTMIRKTVKSEVIPAPDYSDIDDEWRKKQVSFLLAIGLAVVLVVCLLSSMVFLLYKMKRLKRYKIDKKLEFVAKCSTANFYEPSVRTDLTLHSKRASVSSMQPRQSCYIESKVPVATIYSGSQPSDGVYASWPNTDDDGEVVPSDKKGEHESLLVDELVDCTTLSKEYSVYPPCFSTVVAPEHPISTRRVSKKGALTNIANIAEKPPLHNTNMKICRSMLVSRNFQNLICYQHFANYRGSCGDVELRLEGPLAVMDGQSSLNTDVKIVSTSSLVFAQPWVRGQCGSIDVVTVATENHDTGQYFMKKLNPDAPSDMKSKLLLDLKILSSLTVPSVARLEAIVIDDDWIHGDISSVIRTGRLCLLVNNNGGYNLKGFLRSIHYPSQTPTCKTTASVLLSQTTMSIQALIAIISQLSSGLKHLEELSLIHRDVGCRNCMIDCKKQIKLYPGGYVTIPPFEDYCSVEGQNDSINFPLRWLAPESIYKGLFTSKSDVWSFGVTMWEVLTMCSMMPYSSLANDALLELMSNRDSVPRLPCPQNCPRDLYELMTQCMAWEEVMRPSFKDIDHILQQRTTGTSTSAQVTLPALPT